MQEAEQSLRKAVEISERADGNEASIYATHINNLVLQLKSTGRCEEAEPLYREAIAIREASLGPDHPNIKTGRSNLEALLEDMGKS